jgi:hypothetical protein
LAELALRSSSAAPQRRLAVTQEKMSLFSELRFSGLQSQLFMFSAIGFFSAAWRWNLRAKLRRAGTGSFEVDHLRQEARRRP